MGKFSTHTLKTYIKIVSNHVLSTHIWTHTSNIYLWTHTSKVYVDIVNTYLENIYQDHNNYQHIPWKHIPQHINRKHTLVFENIRPIYIYEHIRPKYMLISWTHTLKPYIKITVIINTYRENTYLNTYTENIL